MKSTMILALVFAAASVQAGPLSDFAEGIGACAGGQRPIAKRAEPMAVLSSSAPAAPLSAPRFVQTHVVHSGQQATSATVVGVRKPFLRVRLIPHCRAHR